MISLQKLQLQYGERFIFRDASATIGASDRIGLVGSNGAGKTTLLKVLAGKIETDDGSVDKANYVTIGYLPQDGIDVSGRPLFTEVESAFESVVDLKKKVDEASNRLQGLDTKSIEYAETLELIGAWEQELDDLDASKLPSKIQAILSGLGFAASDMERDTGEFSGGWQMRIALAKLLLTNPSLLLLDEPTNHLDITSQRWLERFLKSYRGSLLIVSHDRSFLDEICSRTFELSLGKLTIYSGNYSYYEKQSVLRKEQLVKAHANQQREIEKTEQFINRFRAKASKATQVQSRIKALDKIERIEIEQDEAEIAFKFPPAPRSGQTIVEIKDLCKSYGELSVIKNANLRIERGDRIAIVGVNGAGKTTLSKIIAGVESYQAGEIIPGHSTSIAYFAQHQADELDPSLSAFETLEQSTEGQTATELRSILGGFLFRGDDVFKKTSVLSGGERNRLALSKILTRKANFLILDEPTNHLDMRSQAALSRALDRYDGSFLVVSHNRSFVDGIVNKVLEVRKDGLSLFPGNVSDYLVHLDAIDNKIGNQSSQQKTPASPTTKNESASNPKERRKIRALIQNELKPFKSEADKIEGKISALEEENSIVEKKLADPKFYQSGDAKAAMRDYESRRRKIERHYERWNELSEKISTYEERLSKIQ